MATFLERPSALELVNVDQTGAVAMRQKWAAVVDGTEAVLNARQQTIGIVSNRLFFRLLRSPLSALESRDDASDLFGQGRPAYTWRCARSAWRPSKPDKKISPAAGTGTASEATCRVTPPKFLL